jgi:hypothetical protein
MPPQVGGLNTVVFGSAKERPFAERKATDYAALFFFNPRDWLSACKASIEMMWTTF